jgi:AraC-like DNA-binding protein
LYCRVQRFTRALQTVGGTADVGWTELALTCGYYDQSHFNRDFREFAGMSPSQFLAHHRPWLNHVAVD